LPKSVCADLGPQILDKNLDFDLHATPGCIVTGQAEWLRVLIRNLVDNAIRYTPAGGLLRVAVAAQR
jgi:two-component system sensor histidine kinase QseC